MDEPLDELYLTWLYKHVASVRNKNPARSYWGLLRQLYKKEFVWFVPNDDNRVEDGRELRREFFDETGHDIDQNWNELGCSVLEMLIGLSRRLAFEAEGQAQRWFWKLVENLGLEAYNDEFYQSDTELALVDIILDRLVWRQYAFNGAEGGLFPLQYPDRDQREVEIWYQMSAYMLQN